MAFKPVLAHASCVFDIAGFCEIGETLTWLYLSTGVVIFLFSFVLLGHVWVRSYKFWLVGECMDVCESRPERQNEWAKPAEAIDSVITHLWTNLSFLNP